MQQDCYSSLDEFQEINNRQRAQFSQHLMACFPQENIIDLVVATSRLNLREKKYAETGIELACNNYHAQKHCPQVQPQDCSTVQEYLEKLKNIR